MIVILIWFLVTSILCSVEIEKMLQESFWSPSLPFCRLKCICLELESIFVQDLKSICCVEKRCLRNYDDPRCLHSEDLKCICLKLENVFVQNVKCICSVERRCRRNRDDPSCCGFANLKYISLKLENIFVQNVKCICSAERRCRRNRDDPSCRPFADSATPLHPDSRVRGRGISIKYSPGNIFTFQPIKFHRN